MKCHICDNITDFECRDCNEPVCEDCCVKMTIHNQIDYAKCTCCEDGDQAIRWIAMEIEEKRQEKLRAEKENKAKLRRANYYKPENIEKRRIRKIENKRLKAELRIKQLGEAMRFVGEMFRFM